MSEHTAPELEPARTQAFLTPAEASALVAALQALAPMRDRARRLSWGGLDAGNGSYVAAKVDSAKDSLGSLLACVSAYLDCSNAKAAVDSWLNGPSDS